MKKILLVWDVKSKGSPATLFYRALCGYDYPTKSGKSHSNGVLDEIPDGVWEFINRSTLLIEEEYAKMVEEIFREFGKHLLWHRFEVEV
ncbi:MAG: hypothetical protein QMC89_05940 [Candidatus Hodarchaeaceae archaeon]|nr:hypothetical protein [Candidatus Hodarchaeaceae archaeon]